jgi:hypothetical protein
MPEVINIYKDKEKAASPKALYIGRPSGNEQFHFGNPASHLPNSKAKIKVNNVNESVRANKEWLEGTAHQNVEPERRKWILNNLDKVRNADYVVCFCKPGPCHGDTLVAMALANFKKREL